MEFNSGLKGLIKKSSFFRILILFTTRLHLVNKVVFFPHFKMKSVTETKKYLNVDIVPQTVCLLAPSGLSVVFTPLN